VEKDVIMKAALYLLLFLSLTNDAFAFGKRRPVIEPAPVTTPTPAPEPSYAPKPPGNITFVASTGYGSNEAVALGRAQNVTNAMFQSKCFHDFMVARGLKETLGLTPEQVVDKHKTARLTVSFEMYDQEWSKVIGYHVLGDKPIVHNNRKYFDGTTDCDHASNDSHETSHVIGFDHSSAKDYYSVPYSINAAFEECCDCVGLKCVVSP